MRQVLEMTPSVCAMSSFDLFTRANCRRRHSDFTTRGMTFQLFGENETLHAEARHRRYSVDYAPQRTPCQTRVEVDAAGREDLRVDFRGPLPVAMQMHTVRSIAAVNLPPPAETSAHDISTTHAVAALPHVVAAQFSSAVAASARQTREEQRREEVLRCGDAAAMQGSIFRRLPPPPGRGQSAAKARRAGGGGLRSEMQENPEMFKLPPEIVAAFDAVRDPTVPLEDVSDADSQDGGDCSPIPHTAASGGLASTTASAASAQCPVSVSRLLLRQNAQLNRALRAADKLDARRQPASSQVAGVRGVTVMSALFSDVDDRPVASSVNGIAKLVRGAVAEDARHHFSQAMTETGDFWDRLAQDSVDRLSARE